MLWCSRATLGIEVPGFAFAAFAAALEAIRRCFLDFATSTAFISQEETATSRSMLAVICNVEKTPSMPYAKASPDILEGSRTSRLTIRISDLFSVLSISFFAFV